MAEILMENKRKGIYIHVPVCRRKCAYCAFFSVGERKMPGWEPLVDSFLAELSVRAGELDGADEVTLYIGGGTPSLMPEAEFRRLAAGVAEIAGIASGRRRLIEFTVEVNPDDVSPQMARCWSEAGADRISMGVQSLVDNELRRVGRRHTASQAIEAYGILRRYFSNISLDLMFGLPEQTLESLGRTLDGFVGMRPEHISAYSLMYEERTVLTGMRDAGMIEETPDDVNVAMFSMVGKSLSDAGYSRYEISNYSLPGMESKHNMAYWLDIPYIGIGPSAHSYDGGLYRSWNVADIDKYVGSVSQGVRDCCAERLTDDEKREEMIMTGLRMTRGFDLALFRTRFGESGADKLLRRASGFIAGGALVVEGDRLRLTESGIMISDSVISDLF